MTRRMGVGLVAGMAVLGLVGVVAALQPWSSTGVAATPSEQPTAEQVQATAEIRRGDLTREEEFDASVGYGDSWTVAGAVSGIVTSHPPAGAVIQPGEELVRVDDRPIILVDGAMPLYRELAVTTGKPLTGADVQQLQAYLIGTGHTADGRLQLDGQFGPVTRQAVKDWQEAVGLPVTGKVDATQMVFSPEPLRIDQSVRVGAEHAGVTVTSATPVVTADTANRDRETLDEGTTVMVEFAADQHVEGTVTDQQPIRRDDGSAITRSTIAVTGSVPGGVDSATVHTSETVATDELLVPVSALVALAEGGYAVEGVEETATRLVRVELGEVVDAAAAVSGQLSEGQRVVVPE